MRQGRILESCVALLLAFSTVLLSGCAVYTASAPTEEYPEGWEEYEPPADVEVQTEIRYIYETRAAEVVYVSQSEREEWREGIERLLSNVLTPVYVTGGELMGYVAPHPDRPALEPGCCAVALFDIDLDGTPEILGQVNGGSSGSGYYYAHDLVSGEYIGTLHGGGDGSWAVYFDREGGDLEVMCEYSLRFGWPSQRYSVSRATLAQNVFGRDKEVYESSYLSVEYEEISIQRELSEEERQEGVSVSYDTAYTALSFGVNGERVGPDEYYREYGYFADNYLRVDGSGIQSLSWIDVAGEAEDADERARLMADALIGSTQKFVKYVKK